MIDRAAILRTKCLPPFFSKLPRAATVSNFPELSNPEYERPLSSETKLLVGGDVNLAHRNASELRLKL